MARKNQEVQCSFFYNSVQLKLGYFLLEFVIYIATSIILGSALFVLLSGVYKAMPSCINRTNQFAQLILISDRLAQDILTMELLQNDFCINKVEKDVLQLQTKQGSIKWFLNNERLIRQFASPSETWRSRVPIVSTVTVVTKRNISKNYAVVCNGVKSFDYLLDIKNNDLIGIYYKINASYNLYVENYIAMRASSKIATGTRKSI